VVDDRHIIDDALDVEAAADAGEFAEGFANQIGRNTEIKSDGSSGRGIADVVNARGVQQTEQAKVFATEGEAKFAIQALEINVADHQVGLMGDTVGDDGALDAGNDGLHVGFVKAKDGGAVKRYAIHELHENALNFLERRILIEMFAVDGGDHSDDGRK